MSYIYRLPENYSLFPNEQKINLEYLSVKTYSTYLVPLGNVAIYAKNNEGEGIFGFATILSEKTMKSSQIDPDKNINFINRNNFQIKIRYISLSVHPLIDIRHLRFFPSFHSNFFQKPYNPYVLYRAGALHWEYSYLEHRFSYNFCENVGPPYFGDRYWGFYIHILREQQINYFWNKKLPKKNNHCNTCGVKSDYPYFLEIHDTVKMDFDSEYQPINIKDFIVLCPTCHKKKHLELRDNRKIS